LFIGIISHNDVDVIIQNCKDKRFKTLAPFILKPLASALQEAKTDNSEEAIALASVYIGILSFHLLIPSSPLDPGMKPAAKVAEWNSYLQTLSSRLVAIRMESGLSTGNFYPSTQNATALLEEATFATNKQSRQEKKRVTRPPDVLPFHQLFREVQHFSKTIANVQNILGLLNSFSEEENNQTHTASIAKEINWQSSASAFFNKVASNYTSYEDVTSPFLAALGMMQNGIRSYVQCKYTANESTKLLVLDIQDNLLQYPNISFNDRIDNKNISHISDAFDSHDMIDSHEVQIQKLGKRCKFSYLMASLSHLVLLKTANIPKEDDWIKLSSLLFGSMARAWDLAGEQSMDEEPGREESEEERNEREYRDHFPDHRKDFTKIIEATEVAASGQYEDVSEDEEESNDDIIVDNVSISDQESNLLAELHFAMYSQKGAALNDSSRIQAFVQMYTAGALINHVTARSHVMQSECNRFNAHCFALSLNSMNENGIPFSTALMTSSDQNALDFHRDPNPIEVLKAYRPLKDLLHRISQLLRAFPGNSILIAIGQVAEMMLQLDINKVSLGKMLTGLEVVLRKAQDWEQHASHRVALGEKLSHISKLVAQWRKLELQSWSYLLDMRDKHYIVRSRRHWMRMYLLLMTEKIGDSDSSMINKNNESCFPSWVWKGVASKVNNLSSPNKDIVNEEDIMEIIKALDTFILTSGIGHFNERLRLIEAFANQLKEECKLSSKPSRRIKATILTSLHEHYSKFIPIIAAEKERLRKPIEKRLKGDVKLAKWDEQSYYALAESAEKSHMKLMMIVREYDEVLQTSVGKILENNFLRGIRSHGEVTKGTPTVEPVTEIPPSVSIFPALQDEKDIGKDKNHYSVLSDNVEHLREADRIWTPIEESSSSPYISGMQRYFKKMNQMFTEKSVKPDTHASKGGETTNLACETIFDRIESLRGKGTKPMKQRALVDLIKYLRKQGYSSMKWSVPKEIRQMNSLLQLPSPTLTGLNGPHAKALEESENYFRRSTIELSRLRSEVAMLGSAYMSKREMDLMTGFGEHGLLMLCQQRSAITSTISKLQSINDLINAFDKIHSSLPNNQLSLLESTENFDRTYTSLLEALQQSFLAIKKIALLNKEEGGSYRDTLGILEGCCSLLKQSYQPRFNDLFITKERLETVARVVIDLEKVQSDINICSMQSRGSSCLPSHFFDPCIKQLKKCFGYAGDIKQIESEIVLEDDNGKCMTKVNSLLSEIVKSSLLVAQNLQKGSFEKMDKDDMMDKEDDSVKMDDEETIWASHSNVLNEWNMIYLDKFKNLLLDLREQFVMNNVPEDNKALYQLSVDANCLVLKVIDVCKDRLADFISFFRNTSKFEYVKLRLFRILVSKGFCADDVEEGGDGEGDGGNMNFEDDVEGTGMGEGDGKNDVTDQIEDEEQLLGLKGDEDKEKQSNDKNELDEEEADTGMEMENEFDGELFDVPDKQEDENGEDDDEEEELDREMGDGEDPNEQVVDEKMWDEDDDDEDGEEQQKEEEKFEKDSKMSGEALQDELRTKEDDEEEGGKGKEDGEKPEDSGEQKHDEEIPKEDTDEGQDQDQPGKEEEDEIVNDDFEDNYEDKHAGIDVRNEEEDGNDADGPEEDEEEAMDLNDDLNLDDGEEGEDANNEDANNDENEEREGDEDDPEDDGEGGEGEHIDEDMEDEDDEEMDADGVQNAHQTLGEDDQMNADDNQEDKPEENEEEDDQAIDNTNAQEEQQPEAHGVAAKSGADTIKRVEDDEEEDGDNDDAGGEDNDDEENGGEGDNNESNPGAGGQTNDSSGDFQSGQEESSQTKTPKSTAMDAPNPFRDPGDAEKFWHKKLDMITENEDSNADANDNEEEKEEDATGGDEKDTDGTFEFTSQNQDNTTQVLGGVNEEDAPQLDQEEEKAEDAQDDIDMDMGDEKEKDEDESQQPPPSSKRDDKKKLQKQSNSEEDKTAPSAMDNQNNKEGDETEDINMDDVDSDNDSNGHDNNDDNNEDKDNKVVTDLSQLQVNEGEDSQNPTTDNNIIEYENHTTGTISLMEAEESRKKWSKLNAETNNLSRRLCEKLRLVLEPLVASKLRGDYRTGKRINMKRVIGYIASGYRKDKIWLRRTKPGKRDYRVLLAVDNSESMKSNGGGEVALMALATLATGMSQLEIGQLGVASFGEEMKLLHPFHAPFTSSSGADLVSNFTFDDKRTRTALCVESAIAALESQSENSSSSSSMQLVFMISDGRIERDSRDDLRRLVREMTERSILLVMIIVEGDNRKGSMKNKDKDSIVNMKEVSFVNGKPKVKYFIEDYPFPYYMVLQDMNTLPEVLGDALKQWFEMMSQNNS
jgi:midasin (ATPase involved in ribosome maturation)